MTSVITCIAMATVLASLWTILFLFVKADGRARSTQNRLLSFGAALGVLSVFSLAAGILAGAGLHAVVLLSGSLGWCWAGWRAARAGNGYVVLVSAVGAVVTVLAAIDWAARAW